MLDFNSFTFIVTLLNLLILIIIPVLAGVFVWRDAKRRGMNHLLWTLVATFIPFLLGLIAYLIVASQHKPLLECPGCRTKVDQEFQLCPQCGYQLQESCPQCHKTVSPDWNLCPSCGQQLK